MKKVAFSAAFAALLGASGFSIAGGLDTAGEVFVQVCSACHGADGRGTLPGVPDFTDNQGPLSKTDAQLVDSIMNGFQSESSTMAMPPKGGVSTLTEAQAADLVDYLRDRF